MCVSQLVALLMRETVLLIGSLKPKYLDAFVRAHLVTL